MCCSELFNTLANEDMFLLQCACWLVRLSAGFLGNLWMDFREFFGRNRHSDNGVRFLIQQPTMNFRGRPFVAFC